MPGHGVTFRPLDFIFLLESATYLCLKNGKILPAAIICAYFMFRSALYIVSSQSNVMLRKTLILKLKSLYCKIDRYALKETQPKKLLRGDETASFAVIQCTHENLAWGALALLLS